MTIITDQPTATLHVPRTVLPRSGLGLSRLGLGLAHMHTMPSVADRRRLIFAALDLGITHFDTARLYSDGLSESTLGHALVGLRHQVTITTKFGLLPTPIIGSLDGGAAYAARKLRSLFVKSGLLAYPRRSYTAATLTKSLHASLKALKTDHIDIYMVHEPADDSAPPDEMFEELERHKRAGTIRFTGVSGATIDPFVTRYGSLLDVVQSAEGSWALDRHVPDITHSLLSGMSSRGSAIQLDAVKHAVVTALLRRPQGAVIVQTRRPAHLTQLAEWAASVD
jgi:aryl-alcohol dehydrogenase-like predicted oxidoreductase